MKALMILTAALMAGTGAARAATYYVDSQRGGDGNPGTEAARPWKTLAKVNELTLKPGDRLLFRCGSRWTGTVMLRGTGEKWKRVFVGKYGKGPLPRIDGGGARAAVRIQNPSYLTVMALEVTNSGKQDGKTLRSGVEVVWDRNWRWKAPKPKKGQKPARPGTLSLRHLFVHNVDGVVTRRTRPSFYGNAGIMIQNGSSQNLEDVRVEKCRLIDVRGVGCYIRCSGSNKGPRAMNENVRFCGNTIRRTGADGLIVTHGRNVFAGDNRCYDIGALGNRGTSAIAGIWVGWHCHNSVFQGNEVARTRCWGKDGNAFDVDNECTGTHIFQHNYTHGNQGGVLMVMPSAKGRVIYRHNVSVNDFKAPHPQKKPAFWLVGSGPVLVHNNTFVMDNGSPLSFSDNPRLRVVNNIFHQTKVKVAHPARPTFRRNCFFGEQEVKDPRKIAVDPEFADPGPAGDGMESTERWRLKPDSPCVRAGVGEVEPGERRSIMNRPDVGALPYLSNAGLEFRQWRVTQLVFVADPGEKPPMEVEVSFRFSGPGGASLTVPGFWDGGKTWRVRFAPTAPGKWSYQSSCKELAALNGLKGEFTAAPAAGKNRFQRHGPFLRVSGNKRCLTHSDGTPFFWLGDTCWFSPSDRTPIGGSSDPRHPSMFKALIDKRRKQGFTVLHMAFLGPVREGLRVTRPSSWRSEQMTYWRRADRYIEYANDAGILPVIGAGWGPPLAKQPQEEARRAWRYIVARYGAFAVTWLVCGEYNQFNDPESVKAMLPLGAFIKDIDPYRRAMTIHAWYSKKEKRQAWKEPWYDFIMLQGGHKVWPGTNTYLKPYRMKSPKPVLESECNYEGIHGMGPEAVRWAAYRAIQSGSFGYTYGSHGMWNAAPEPEAGQWGPPTHWGKALDRPGGDHMAHLAKLYTSVKWWELEPRPEAAAPEGGRSVHVKCDGDALFLVYFDRGLDPKKKIALKGLKSGATYSAEWFDPRSGKSSPAGDRIRAPKGAAGLPDRPDREDWMLVLRRRK